MIIVSFAFYLSIFSTISTIGTLIQGVVVTLFGLEAARCCLLRKFKYINSQIPASIFTLAFVIPLVSTFSTLIRGNIDAATYGLVLASTMLFLLIILRSHGVKNITKSYVLAMIFGVVTILYSEYNSLIISLIGVNSNMGLIRFSPFNSHPNLIGHIFGMLVTVSSGLLISKVNLRTWEKYVLWVSVVSSIVFIFAASSRGGLMASLGAIILVSILEFRRHHGSFGRKFLAILITSGVVLTVVIFNNDDIYTYFNNMLQLDHPDRGLGSGLTGRTDGWPMVIKIVFSEFSSIFFGFGFRTWSFKGTGIAIDNSYITLLYEVGLISAVAIFSILIYAFMRSILIFNDFERVMSAMVILFIIAESMVIRQMIAIGNPASLFFLCILLNALDCRKNYVRYIKSN
jgi:exopolysaccharide production protein ExoQ